MRFKTDLLLSVSAMAGLCLFVAGCSKSNDNNTIPTGMTAGINGKSFHAFQTAAGVYAYYYQVGGAGTLNGDTVFLTLYIATPVVVGEKVSTDDNGFSEVDYVVHKNNAPLAGYSAYQGQKGPAYYTVTAIDTIRRTIQGTFNGTLTLNGAVSGVPDSVVITNGQFNNPYQ
jgi:hypothetical protein